MPWETVEKRCYSEETFTRIADGRLPQGWDDQAAIDILCIELIAVARKAPGHIHTHVAAPKPTDRAKPPADVRNACDKVTLGVACWP